MTRLHGRAVCDKRVLFVFFQRWGLTMFPRLALGPELKPSFCHSFLGRFGAR